MLRASLKSLLSRKLRLILSGLAVVLAVMFIAGAFVVNETLGHSFDTLFAAAYDTIDIEVSAKPAVGTLEGGAAPVNMPASVVSRIAGTPGVAQATGSVFVDGARLVGRNGKVIPTTGMPRFGSSWQGEDEMVHLRTGRAPRADDEVVFNGTLAKVSGFHVGERVSILTIAGQKQEFTLVGIVEYSGGRDSIGGEQTIAFTTEVAQRLMLGETGVYSAVDVKVAPGADVVAVRDALRRALGAGYIVDTGADLAKRSSDAIRKVLNVVTYVLLGFAAVAVLVGVFLILNTFSIIVAQRTHELALLRAMGASRAQVVGAVLLESLIVGALASAIGFVIGIGLGAIGAYVLGQVAAGLKLAGLSVPVIGAVISFAVGIGVTVVAALVPALRASRVPPVAAMRATSAPDRPLTSMTAAGGALLAAGAVLLAVGLSGHPHGYALWFVLGGVLSVLIGVSLLTPIISRPVVSVLGRLFAWSVPGKLGRLNSGRNPRRTAITAAALMIGIAIVTGISTIFASVQTTIGDLMDSQLQADLVVSGQQGGSIPPAIDPAALRRIRELPGVGALAAEGYDAANVNGKLTYVLAIDDLGAANRVLKLKPTSGQITRLDSGELIMNKSTAKNLKVAVGSTLKIQLARSPERSYRVVGVYADTRVSDGIVLPWSDASTGFRTSQPTTAFIKLAPGASRDQVRRQADDLLADSPEVSVQTRDAYVGQQMVLFDVIIGSVQVLLGIALVIAVLGIINTLVLSVLERTRELGLLRAIGLRRAQTMRMITVEAVVISLFGAMLGLAVGGGLGAAVVRALKDRGFADLALTLPWTLIVVYLVAAAIVGVIAAVIPAIRAARLNVLAAIACE